jgi:hypothetical protein
MEDKDLACLTNGTTSARCGWKYVEAFPRHFLGQRQIEFYLHQGLQPGPTQVRLISPRFYPPKFPKSWDLGIILQYLVFLPSGNTGHLQMNVCVFLLSLWPLGRTRWPDGEGGHKLAWKTAASLFHIPSGASCVPNDVSLFSQQCLTVFFCPWSPTSSWEIRNFTLKLPRDQYPEVPLFIWT